MGKYNITLDSIRCTRTGDGSNTGDDLYFFYYIDNSTRKHRYPAKDTFKKNIKRGDTREIGFTISYNTRLRIELMDSDVGKDDFLGAATYDADTPIKEEKRFTERDGHYTLFSTKRRASKDEEMEA